MNYFSKIYSTWHHVKFARWRFKENNTQRCVEYQKIHRANFIIQRRTCSQLVKCSPRRFSSGTFRYIGEAPRKVNSIVPFHFPEWREEVVGERAKRESTTWMAVREAMKHGHLDSWINMRLMRSMTPV